MQGSPGLWDKWIPTRRWSWPIGYPMPMIAAPSFLHRFRMAEVHRRPREFVATLPVGRAQNEAAVQVARVWAYSDPQALRHGVGIPDGTARYDAMEQVASSWSLNDPIACGKWLATLPEAPGRNARFAIT